MSVHSLQLLHFVRTSYFNYIFISGIGQANILTVATNTNKIVELSEFVGFNVPINTLQVISETSLSCQSLVLVLTT